MRQGIKPPTTPREPIDRRVWVSILAKLTAPMEAAHAAGALAAMLPMLRGYDDRMFCEDSAAAVAKTARVLGDGVYAPITRAPTFGELEGALTRWWKEGPGWHPAVIHEQLAINGPGTRRPLPTDAERAGVAALVAAFVAESREREQASQRPATGRVRPRVSDGHLLATYERMAEAGDKGAAIRVKMLRQKLTAAGIDWSDQSPVK